MASLIYPEVQQRKFNLKISNDNRSDTKRIQGLDISAKDSPDVTDNIPDRIPIAEIKSTFPMDHVLDREEERLKTFEGWPIAWIDKYELAKTGMFYGGVDDKVKCNFCGVEIGRWETNDHPVSEHLRWSPHCPLLRRRTTSNIPINASDLDRILPPMSYDICGLNDTIEIRPNSYPESSTPSRSSSGSLEQNGSAYFPAYPEYQIEAARLRSYANWPTDKKQQPQQLAEAGFFYTGTSDRVKCFSCGGGLMDWHDNDDPWEQHAEWFRHCEYLQLLKGETYIESILKRQEAVKNGTANVVAAPVESSVTSENSSEVKSTDCNGGSAALSEIKRTPPSSAAVEPLETNATAALANTNDNNCDIKEKRSNSNIREEKLCKICYADEYSTAFYPCGHVVACLKCASSVTNCPVCRKSITKVLHIYFS